MTSVDTVGVVGWENGGFSVGGFKRKHWNAGTLMVKNYVHNLENQRKRGMTDQFFFKYWGKAEKAEEGKPSRYHLLPYHCLDVAAVVSVWWDASPAVRRSFCFDREVAETLMRAWLLFFSSLHDYGKFDLRFQRKVPAVWQFLSPLAGCGLPLPSQFDCLGYRHGENGLSWFKQDYFALCGCDVQNNSLFLGECEPEQWQFWKPWIEAVTGHHGYIKQAEFVSESSLPSTCDSKFSAFDRVVRHEWLMALEKLFLHPVGLSIKDNPPVPSPMLAGLCSVADWLASRCDETNFSYQQSPEALHEYFKRKEVEDARRVFKFSGIEGTTRIYGGVRSLLPESVVPHPLQGRIDELPLETGLTIIEAPTGSGKTEAALAYAWRLVSAGLADALIFALPTQATANAMLGRLEKLSGKLFHESPNLLLAHGSARFNKEFAQLKRRGLGDDGEPDGWSQCGAWLAESRKRVFLGQVGVCTIDQVLISVLPVKHRFVREFGVDRSVVIVDEVHAYDAYMYELLEKVLQQQHAANASAILLSATLPAAQRRQLCEAWRPGSECGDGGAKTASYPLITRIGASAPMGISLSQDEQPATNAVNIECLRLDKLYPDADLLKRIIAAAENGAQVAVICNLVNDAQRIAYTMQGMSGAPVDLFHSRFRFKDRQAIEDKIIHHFGPDGLRSKGRILVATQVVEQSLDVDFDWIITQLCPVDLLFQRLGRLHRHKRSSRPDGFSKPLCTVLLPMDGDYGYTGKIYANIRVLWRTEQKLVAAPEMKIVFPAAYREWIEAVYQEEAWKNEPSSITNAYEKFSDELFIARCKARQQIDSAINPFADTDEVVAALTRDGEMSLTVIPFVDSLEGRQLFGSESIDGLDELDRAEVLAMNSINVPARWVRWLREAAEKDDQGRYWLEMHKNKEGYVMESKDLILRYRRDTGLERMQ
jgi:CRISPR-associated endonuclease/helicase Cas3